MIRIIQATAGDQLAIARNLFKNYAASLDFDLDFQNFEQELNDLPGDYAPPLGQILIARLRDETAGCVALRKFDQSCCEMKRLYVRPEFRALGVGRALAEAIIVQARDAGYAAMRLDTVPSMGTARTLYKTLGFKEIPPYRFNPVEGTVYLELKL